MKAWLLIATALALALGACGLTATAGYGAGAAPPPSWLTEDESPAERPPLRHLPPRAITPRRARVHQEMWIGAAVGVLAGVRIGESDRSARADADASCAGGCYTLPNAGIASAIGLGPGAAAGSAIGRFETP
jgi:hypothetical protein